MDAKIAEAVAKSGGVRLANVQVTPPGGKQVRGTQIRFDLQDIPKNSLVGQVVVQRALLPDMADVPHVIQE